MNIENESRTYYLAEQFLDSSTSSSSSSSSSSDEEMECIEKVLDLLPRTTRETVRRILNFETKYVAEWTNEEFRKVFRMNRDSVSFVASKFLCSSSFPYEMECLRTQQKAEQLLLAFLWYAGSNVPFTKTTINFHMGGATLSKVISSLLNFFDKNCERFIKFPRTEDELQKAATDFRRISGFPNVIGCIDGSYISIATPHNKIRSTYCDRHDGTSITLQGICDANRKFIDIFVGCPAKIHDARIYQLSFISQEISSICGDTYHLLGDGAYPLSNSMMTPYRNPQGSLLKQKYNTKLSATRVLIENAFGILKGRFNQLRYLKFHTVEKSSLFVKACCAMHNICIDRNDFWDSGIDDNSQHPASDNDADNLTRIQIRQAGELKRNSIAQTFI